MTVCCRKSATITRFNGAQLSRSSVVSAPDRDRWGGEWVVWIAVGGIEDLKEITNSDSVMFKKTLHPVQ